MLQLKNITKEYVTGDEKVEALKGVELEFRDNEFVSILGPSGCGKTTLLNIIGGLDQYTSGDLIVSGKSTKEFTDRDWDTYRNHRIGFVFQSYNLIMHQTVLSNVELALTLSGVSKNERRRRAIEALKCVGLSDQLNKKPNQMSGGQMQRVAIARALVNDPEILLADEPTGALDSVTSVQIMDLLKDIAKDRLVIMVTHNPELAETYSTRIIKLLDGQVVDDSNPYSYIQELTQQETHMEKNVVKVSKKHTSMGFFTALSLSLNNLLTKKARTALTSFAGSIGIIGIALILSIASGLQIYIDKVQEDTLSTYPISINRQEMNVNSLISTIMDHEDKDINHDMDKIYSNVVLYELMENLMNVEVVENDLAGLKKYLDKNIHNEAIMSVVYGYNMDLNIYHSDTANVRKLNPSNIMKDLESMSGVDLPSMGFDVWSEMMVGKNGEYIHPLVEEQYDVLQGRWPQAYNEVVLVADKNNEINDFVLCLLGFKTEDELAEIIKAAMRGEEIEAKQESWSYDEILDTTFKLVIPTDYYAYDNSRETWNYMGNNEPYMQVLLQRAEDIKIVGIIKPNENAIATSITGTIGYTASLTEYVTQKVLDSEIVKQQLANPDTDIFNGLPFKPDNMLVLTDEQKAETLKTYVNSLNETQRANLAIKILSNLSDTEVQLQIGLLLQQFETREELEQMILDLYQQSTGMDATFIKDMLSKMSDEELEKNIRSVLAEEIKKQYKENVANQLGSKSTEELCDLLEQKMLTSSYVVLAEIYDAYMPSQYSSSNYNSNLSRLGVIDINNPDSVNIYATSFEGKNEIARLLDQYNNGASKNGKIQYTDYVKLILSSVSTIINAISYILIGFVSISLIVSSIMIGIITYISVIERTKEIGVLRAIGASKKDVRRVFNAETLIIGFGSGLIGILITCLLNIPINVVVEYFTDIKNLATLPVWGGIMLVFISMLLTVISGLFPANIAAKKDPVEALRSE
mgnify:CR=1 FL=1